MPEELKNFEFLKSFRGFLSLLRWWGLWSGEGCVSLRGLWGGEEGGCRPQQGRRPPMATKTTYKLLACDARSENWQKMLKGISRVFMHNAEIRSINHCSFPHSHLLHSIHLSWIWNCSNRQNLHRRGHIDFETMNLHLSSLYHPDKIRYHYMSLEDNVTGSWRRNLNTFDGFSIKYCIMSRSYTPKILNIQTLPSPSEVSCSFVLWLNPLSHMLVLVVQSASWFSLGGHGSWHM